MNKHLKRKLKKSEREILATLLTTNSINPLMVLLEELNRQFDYGTTSYTIKTLNELLTHWYDTEGKENNFKDEHTVSKMLYYITRLTGFLSAVNESFQNLKSTHPELEAALEKQL